jgi:O-acetyl-ADP-ribose deacetylase (regulator of RNase III)
MTYYANGNLHVKRGDLFKSPCQTLVNATNCVGIMGGGIAAAFKQRYPEMFEEYAMRCYQGTHTLTKPHLWKNPDPEGKWVLNIATKYEPRLPSELDAIEDGLIWVELNGLKEGITSLAVPALGCGLGGLDWDDVKPVMLYSLIRMAKLNDIYIELYEPQ